MPDDDFLKALEESVEPSPSDELPAGVRDCWSAIKAAADAVGDYCGVMGIKIPVDVDGVAVSAPQEVVDIANSALSMEERITAIMESDWSISTSSNMCERLFGAEPGTPEHEKCVETTARHLAEGLVE